jgi:hypothetical protein
MQLQFDSVLSSYAKKEKNEFQAQIQSLNYVKKIRRRISHAGIPLSLDLFIYVHNNPIKLVTIQCI